MWYTWLQEKTYPPLIRVDPSYRYILLLGDVFAGRPAGGGGGVGDAGTAFLVCLLDHVFLFVVLAQSKDAISIIPLRGQTMQVFCCDSKAERLGYRPYWEAVNNESRA
jgi:hypothetical protein